MAIMSTSPVVYYTYACPYIPTLQSQNLHQIREYFATNVTCISRSRIPPPPRTSELLMKTVHYTSLMFNATAMIQLPIYIAYIGEDTRNKHTRYSTGKRDICTYAVLIFNYRNRVTNDISIVIVVLSFPTLLPFK